MANDVIKFLTQSFEFLDDRTRVTIEFDVHSTDGGMPPMYVPGRNVKTKDFSPALPLIDLVSGPLQDEILGYKFLHWNT